MKRASRNTNTNKNNSGSSSSKRARPRIVKNQKNHNNDDDEQEEAVVQKVDLETCTRRFNENLKCKNLIPPWEELPLSVSFKNVREFADLDTDYLDFEAVLERNLRKVFGAHVALVDQGLSTTTATFFHPLDLHSYLSSTDLRADLEDENRQGGLCVSFRESIDDRIIWLAGCPPLTNSSEIQSFKTHILNLMTEKNPSEFAFTVEFDGQRRELLVIPAAAGFVECQYTVKQWEMSMAMISWTVAFFNATTVEWEGERCLLMARAATPEFAAAWRNRLNQEMTINERKNLSRTDRIQWEKILKMAGPRDKPALIGWRKLAGDVIEGKDDEEPIEGAATVKEEPIDSEDLNEDESSSIHKPSADDEEETDEEQYQDLDVIHF